MSEPRTKHLDGLEGTVKWFDPRKGYGFIIGPDGQDIFVHFSIIEGEGFRILKDGITVLYDAALTSGGWKATKVTRLESIVITPVGQAVDVRHATHIEHASHANHAGNGTQVAPVTTTVHKTYSRTPRR